MRMPAGAAALPPLSLYVHIPWCVRKCPYCDFNSHGLRQPLPEADYVAALIADLDAALPYIAGRDLISIFFGGGTPSLFSGQAIEAILTAIRARLPLAHDAEITLEANPGTVEAEKFAAFRAAGVNRLSLGIQSFNPVHLQVLGRIHDEREAHRAIEIAQRHFDAINLDLMYGLPQQTFDQALADLGQALCHAPAHLSCYQLAIEPNTAFAARPPLLNPDLCADMQEAIETQLAAAGYRHYETSAFARPGRQCRHNCNYWTFGDYLGIGAGAHSKLTLPPDIVVDVFAEATSRPYHSAIPLSEARSGAPAHEAAAFRCARQRIIRQARWAQPRRYMAQAAAGCACQETLLVSDTELPGEFMMNALRLNQGFDAALFSERTGLALARIAAPLRQARAEGLIKWRVPQNVRTHPDEPMASGDEWTAPDEQPALDKWTASGARPPQPSMHITPTRRGRLFLNRLLALFLP